MSAAISNVAVDHENAVTPGATGELT